MKILGKKTLSFKKFSFQNLKFFFQTKMAHTFYVLLFLVTNPFLNISAYVRQSKFISQPNCGQPFFQPFVEKSSSGRIIGGFESLSNSFPWYKIEIL